ncbi:V-type ATP synthase subunit D [Thiorhodococcus minor]|uniref:ATPase n=1 Tax=Thiorhodococcus minor TaxID=57489 RepID=A0A6M0JXR7_9GAMM|nr:V-type ATP synthase subunit D [Thiorhodococcus minor]NEV61834.1 ATPase [Thiorhodococcus minor]
MTVDTIIPTQSALLELKEERAGLQEGYRFLDEKRLILAAEIVAEIARYERGKADFDADYAAAGKALEAAVARHGLQDLALYPALDDSRAALELSERKVIGVALQEVRLTGEEPGWVSPSIAASPEGDACRVAYRGLMEKAARLAAMSANLERLRVEYARTARRARALEDVLLPEVQESLASVEAALEELEREESVRARRSYDRR